MKRIITAITLALCFFARADAEITTISGSQFRGSLDGQGLETMYQGPDQIAISPFNGNAFIRDGGSLRELTMRGGLTTVKNVSIPPGRFVFTKGGTLYFSTYQGISKVTGVGTVSQVASVPAYNNEAQPIAIDSKGVLYIGQFLQIKVIKNGVASVFVGSGNIGQVDGRGIFSSFQAIRAFTFDAFDNLYVGDGQKIRRVAPDGTVTTVAGDASGNVADGPALSANFGYIKDMAVKDGVVFILDADNIRALSGGTVTTLVNLGASTVVKSPAGMAVESTNSFLVTGGSQIHRVTIDALPAPVPPEALSLGAYPGIKITGPIGRSYRIEATTDLSQQSGWEPAGTVTATKSPLLWIDESGVNVKRFYRAVGLP